MSTVEYCPSKTTEAAECPTVERWLKDLEDDMIDLDLTLVFLKCFFNLTGMSLVLSEPGKLTVTGKAFNNLNLMGAAYNS